MLLLQPIDIGCKTNEICFVFELGIVLGIVNVSPAVNLKTSSLHEKPH